MAGTKEVKTIRPQEGYQMKALSSNADIVIGGGSAGAGKTYSLLLEPLRHLNVEGFGGVIFRRTSPQIRLEGGLWDTSMNIYPFVNATPRESSLEWTFPKGWALKFSHLEYEKNILDWQGSQIPFIGFDELTHFSEKMFFYLLTRNRSTCGIKPYVRATCNPDPDSWVAELIAWWIDQETGFPIPERDGVVRYFLKDGANYIWGDTIEEVLEKGEYFVRPLVDKSGVDAKEFIKSITFVSGNVYQNKELLSVNPAYLSNLASQDADTKSQLLEGNWKAVVSGQEIFERYRFIQLFDRSQAMSEKPKKYITGDIAGKGSDKFIVGVWDDKRLIDIKIMDKSNGVEVIDTFKDFSQKYNVPNNCIVYDADGIGSLLDGFFPGAVGFNNGGTPIGTVKNSKDKPNYTNLKTQCYYETANDVNAGLYSIDESVGCIMYDDKMTVKQRFIYEQKAIKRDKADADGKLKIIPKEQMKVILMNQSPDMMDMFMMRKVFDLKPLKKLDFSQVR
jgi:hypothetical protein